MLLLSPLPVPAAEPAPAQIQVTGTGSISLPPDLANVTGVIQTYDGHNASVAVGTNSDIYNRVVNAIVATGIARGDITLSSYSLNYTAPPNDRSGYTVNRYFTVTVHQLNLAGSVIDAATDTGATQIGVSFGLSNTQSAIAQALQRAVADATVKANSVAAAAHLHIVGVSQMEIGTTYVPMPRAVEGDLYVQAAVHAPTTLDTSNTTITQTVTVTFLAKP